jgi:hypothetical protein
MGGTRGAIVSGQGALRPAESMRLVIRRKEQAGATYDSGEGAQRGYAPPA